MSPVGPPIAGVSAEVRPPRERKPREWEVTTSHGAVEEHLESASYLQQRQLKSGSAGWVLLAGLGVSYVVSGDYSGWNFGLAQGGDSADWLSPQW